jgi:uncharacterized protein (TIGR03437 family)
MRTRTAFLFLSLIALRGTVSAQNDNVLWDSSGNGMLAGTYHFRQVVWQVADQAGDIGDAVVLYGNIVFDGLRDANGNGNYSLTASFFQNSQGTLGQLSNVAGTYRISASGLGYLDSQIFTGGKVWGTVSQGGIFIGSSTEDGTAGGTNDMFVAAKLPAITPTNASFTGSYTIAEVNFPVVGFQNDTGSVLDAMFQINPDGAGNLGAINANGYIGSGNTNIMQAIGGATYSFNGAGLGTLNFGGTLTATNLVAGSWIFYMSPDKRFIFGGSVEGFDLFVGVLAPPTNTAPPNLLNGLYYQTGVDEDLTNFTSASSNLSTYFGSFQATAGTLVGHQRLLNTFDGVLADYTPFDYTFSDTFAVNPNATMDDFLGLHYVVGAGGDIRVGIGTGVKPGINVALRAPAFNGPGVFLNPTGVINWFSSAPFTVGVSPGAFMALSGTGLTGVNKVLVNGRQAFILSVSDTLVIIVVPYGTPTSGTAVSIQAFNGAGGSSAALTVFPTLTTPGVLAANGGTGGVIAQHITDFSLVTENNKAQPGEIILFYVGGLGNVNPPVADGVPAPLSPLSFVAANLSATVDSVNATILFAGLTPTLIADYAFIVVIPPGTQPGDAFLDVSGPDSITDEATIPIGNGVVGVDSDTTTTPAVRVRTRPAKPAPGSTSGSGR